MKKKKIIFVSLLVAAITVFGAGTVLASTEGRTRGGRTLDEKLTAIEERVDEGSMTRDEADVIIEKITSCDEDCDGTGDCDVDRPEDGYGIFGSGLNDGDGAHFGEMNGDVDHNGYADGNSYGNGNGPNGVQDRVGDGTCLE